MYNNTVKIKLIVYIALFLYIASLWSVRNVISVNIKYITKVLLIYTFFGGNERNHITHYFLISIRKKD